MPLRFVLCLLCLVASAAAFAASDTPSPSPPAQPQTLVLDGSWVHDVGNLHMNITNIGLIGSRPGAGAPYSHAPSAVWPAGSGIEYLWAAGLWVGAIKDGVVSVSTGQYATEILATADPLDVIYEQFQDLPGGARYPDPLSNDDVDDAEDEDPLNARDDDGDGWIDEDYGAIGDQHFYASMFDDTPLAQQIYPDHRPLNIQVIQESFQWADGRFDDFVGMRYTVRNVGESDLSDVYLGLWVDSDIGHRSNNQRAQDDAVGFYEESVPARDGSLVPLRIAYMYDWDLDGDVAPGYFGVMLLAHPTDLTGLSAPAEFGPTSLHGYFGTNDPVNDAQRYDAMSTATIDVPQGVADYRYLVSVGPFARLRPDRDLVLDLAFVAGEGLQGLIENATEAALTYYGQWFDRDGDPQTGTQGRETRICESDFGPPGPTNPIFTLFATCVTAEDLQGPNPPSPIAPEDLDEEGCILIDADCPFELLRRGQVDCRLDGEIDPDELAGCTGVGGKEFGVAWYATSTPIPAVVGHLEGDVVEATVLLTGDVRLPMDAPLFVERASTSNQPSRRWEHRDLTLEELDRGHLRLSLRDADDVGWPREYRLGYVDNGQDVVLATASVSQELPDRLALEASPNPFNPKVVLRYRLPRPGPVRVSIVDARGRLVRELVNRDEIRGVHQSPWDGRDERGRLVASGVYVARLELGTDVVVRRLALIR